MKLLNSTVIVPAPDFNLTTLASLKMEYDIRDDSQDAYLESQIPRVSDDIAGHCRRIFALQRYTDTFDGSPWVRGIRYFLANRPVVPGSVSIDVDGSTLGDGSWSVDYEAGIIDCLTWTGMALAITYDAGWRLPGWSSPPPLAGPPLPPSVQFVANQMVNVNRQMGRLQYSDRDLSIRSETVDGVGSVTYGPSTGATSGSSTTASGLAVGVMSRLDRFVIPVAR